jgi:hypothetical protein
MGDVMSNQSNVDSLSALFSRAKAGHVAYERDILQGTDPDWAGWYARYLLDNGSQSISAWPANMAEPDALASLLRELDSRHRAAATEEPWPDYYARHILGAS